MSSPKRFITAITLRRVMLLLTALTPLVFCGGCQRKAVVGPRQAELQPTRSETSPFEVAVDFMNRLEEFQPARARDQVIYNLRQWSREQKPSVVWFADPMLRRLPSEYKELVSVDQLSTSEFDPFDAYVLQEAVWLRDVARSVSSRPLVDRHLADWLQAAVKDGQLTADRADDLALAYRLFDWTIRHIQLDPEREDKDIMGGEKELARRDEDTLRHIYYPWENLLYGHGDWLERSRVFILLARQLGIQVVMLSVDQDDATRSKPWLPAALIGDDLYLFDTLRGLPLPGTGEASIARLADLLDDPQRLHSVGSDAFRHRISASELENLSAAIDATPAALSQRMELVEARLTGDKKTVLTVTPTRLAVKLRTCRGINRVEIWTFPYQGYLFRSLILREQLQQRSADLALLQFLQTVFHKELDQLHKELDQQRFEGLSLMEFLQQERRPFDWLGFEQQEQQARRTFEWPGFLQPEQTEQQVQTEQQARRPIERRRPVRQGRLLQYRGYFRGEDDDPGAIDFLVDCRIAPANFDVEFDALPPNSPLLRNLPEDDDLPELRRQVSDALPPDSLLLRNFPEIGGLRRQAFEQRMRDYKALIIQSKHLATYWLGLIAFEKRDFKVAIDYFQQWVLDRQLESPWRQGAQYNLARAYEVIGLRDEDPLSIEMAIGYYEQDEATPQRAGNLLRARRLRNLSRRSE